MIRDKGLILFDIVFKFYYQYHLLLFHNITDCDQIAESYQKMHDPTLALDKDEYARLFWRCHYLETLRSQYSSWLT